MKILVVDVGGTNVKFQASDQPEPRRFPSGKKLTAQRMVEQVLEHTRDWLFEVVSLGYPGETGAHGPKEEPLNLGPGWVDFNYPAAFGRPVKILNDAAMQALGSYEDGRMLF